MDIEIKYGPSKKRLCLYTDNIGQVLPLDYIENQAITTSTVAGKLEKPKKVNMKTVEIPENINFGAIEQLLQSEISEIGQLSIPEDFGKTLVYMGGCPYSPLMFIGEAPGADEDFHGEPFIGLAGKKLTEIIEGGLRVPREAVTICNLLKHRPPDNRNPKTDEIEKYEIYLENQIDLLKPAVIITLGKFATNWVLNNPQSTAIKASRGRVHELDTGIRVVATYHPSYLIRQYSVQNRRAILKDMTMVVDLLTSMNLYPWWI